MAVIGALGKLGDKQAVAPLLAKLDDQDDGECMTVIAALGELGDKRAVPPLLAKLDDQSYTIGVTAAAALDALGEPNGLAALLRFLTAKKAIVREDAICAYAQYKDISDQLILSRDLDAAEPWLDPEEPVTEVQVAKASRQLNITLEQVRARYEALAVDLNLKLSWKS